MIAYKFNPAANSTLDHLKNSTVYKIKEKLLREEKLQKEDKEFLVEKINCNTFSKTGIPLMGWMFTFKEFTKLYVVEIYDTTHQYRAVDETSLKKYLNSMGYSNIGFIVEVPGR